MGYQGPGPAVIGQAAYDAEIKKWNDTAGGLIGSAILAPIATAEALVPDLTPEPDPEQANITTLHVQTALKLVKSATAEECAVWLTQELGRAAGARPTLVSALEARLT